MVCGAYVVHELHNCCISIFHCIKGVANGGNAEIAKEFEEGDPRVADRPRRTVAPSSEAVLAF